MIVAGTPTLADRLRRKALADPIITDLLTDSFIALGIGCEKIRRKPELYDQDQQQPECQGRQYQSK